MERFLQSVTIFINVGLVRLSDCCYNDYSFPFCSYCSGYCSGSYGHQECKYTNMSAGGIVGIVIGSLIGLALLTAIIVMICATCNRTAGQRGRVIQPSGQGVAVVHSQGMSSYYNGGPTPMMHHMSYSTYPQPNGATYPPSGMSQPETGPPQPPEYTSIGQGPPLYKT